MHEDRDKYPDAVRMPHTACKGCGKVGGVRLHIEVGEDGGEAERWECDICGAAWWSDDNPKE
jgi:hypothetical protein